MKTWACLCHRLFFSVTRNKRLCFARTHSVSSNNLDPDQPADEMIQKVTIIVCSAIGFWSPLAFSFRISRPKPKPTHLKSWSESCERGSLVNHGLIASSNQNPPLSEEYSADFVRRDVAITMVASSPNTDSRERVFQFRRVTAHHSKNMYLVCIWWWHCKAYVKLFSVRVNEEKKQIFHNRLFRVSHVLVCRQKLVENPIIWQRIKGRKAAKQRTRDELGETHRWWWCSRLRFASNCWWVTRNGNNLRGRATIRLAVASDHLQMHGTDMNTTLYFTEESGRYPYAINLYASFVMIAIQSKKWRNGYQL